MPNALPISSGAEQVADEAEDLRHHDRSDRPLQRAAGDQRLHRRRRCTRDRRQREPGGADEQNALAPEHVAEPTAGEQHDGHRQRVRGGDPLQVGVGAAEVGADRGRRHVGDGRVQQVHQGRCQSGGEGHPAPARGR
jgi:hypothetical protein